jgi:hypothetical protein
MGRAPDAQVNLNLAALLVKLGRVGAANVDHASADRFDYEAGSTEVLAEVVYETRVRYVEVHGRSAFRLSNDEDASARDRVGGKRRYRLGLYGGRPAGPSADLGKAPPGIVSGRALPCRTERPLERGDSRAP